MDVTGSSIKHASCGRRPFQATDVRSSRLPGLFAAQAGDVASVVRVGVLATPQSPTEVGVRVHATVALGDERGERGKKE
jgi:hypothetical protein